MEIIFLFKDKNQQYLTFCFCLEWNMQFLVYTNYFNFFTPTVRSAAAAHKNALLL